MNQYEAAYREHAAAAHAAYALLLAHCGGMAPPRVPGMDTVIRLAWRIRCGLSIKDAGAAEYVYRWHLAIRAPDQLRWGLTGRDSPLDCPQPNEAASIFGAPHTIGM